MNKFTDSYSLITSPSYKRDNQLEAGLLFEDNVITIIFPRGLNHEFENEKELRDNTLLLMKTLLLFHKRTESKTLNLDMEEITKGNKDINFPLESIIWLLEDYQNNGIYFKSSNVHVSTNQGIINWSKTIKNKVPLKNNKTFFYPEFVSNSRINHEHELTLIHKYIITECISILGWLYPNIHIKEPQKIPFSRKRCLQILTKELVVNNNSQTIHLISKLIEFLKMYTGNVLSNSFLKNIYTTNFEYVWEDIVYRCLNNVELSNYYPNAIWNIDSSIFNASRLRPDTVIHTDKNLFILDAKYYNYHQNKTIKNLPQTSDIIKQIAYEQFMMEKYKIDTHSFFILPSNTNIPFLYLGTANFKLDKENPIFAVYVDTKIIMKAYINYSRILEQDFLNFVKNGIKISNT